jgi:hypothetical protein
MAEVIWVAIFGAGLAWLQARSGDVPPPEPVRAPVDDEWHRWEQEIHDWKDG